MPLVFLLITVLSGPEAEKPAIPDYFDGNGGGARQGITQCTLRDESVSGTFKTCRYDCGTALTVGERFVCPFVLSQ